MKERAKNLVTGSVVLAGLVGLLALLVLFGWLPRLGDPGYAVTIELDDAGGVNPGSRVNLAGIDAGKVEQVAFREPFDGGVHVTARIEDEVRIPATAIVVVERELLGGSSTLKFVIEKADMPIDVFLPRDGTATVAGGPGAFENAVGGVRTVAEDFGVLSAQWTEVAERLNAFMAGEATAETPGPVGAAVRVIASLDARLAELEKVIAGADAFVNDPQLRDDLTATGRNLREVSARAGGQLEALQGRYLGVADELSRVLTEAQVAMEAANRGQGTLGKTLNDPALYDNLNDAALRIGTAVDEMRLLLEKWKAEGVPVSF